MLYVIVVVGSLFYFKTSVSIRIKRLDKFIPITGLDIRLDLDNTEIYLSDLSKAEVLLPLFGVGVPTSKHLGVAELGRSSPSSSSISSSRFLPKTSMIS